MSNQAYGTRLLLLLTTHEIITSEQATQAGEANPELPELYLLEQGWVDRQQLREVAARSFSTDPAESEITYLEDIVSHELQRKHRLFPVALKEDDEDPGPDKSLRDPTLPSPDNPSSDRVNRANINPHIALTQVAKLNGLSPPLAELCRDVAEGRIPPTSEDLICKMGAALDGTLTGAVRDKATGASKSSSSTSKKKRGRPTDTDSHAADRRIYEAWQTHQYKTYKELAREKGMDERAIRLALHRHRARLNRSKTTP